MAPMIVRFLKKVWVSEKSGSPKGYWSENLTNVSDHDPLPVRANRASKIIDSFSRQNSQGNLPSFGSGNTISVSIPLRKFDPHREDILKLYMQSNKGGSLKVDIWLRRIDGSEGIYLFGSDLLLEQTSEAVGTIPRVGISGSSHYFARLDADLHRSIGDHEFYFEYHREFEVVIYLTRQSSSDFTDPWNAVLEVMQL
jgi:hypothetical protein